MLCSAVHGQTGSMAPDNAASVALLIYNILLGHHVTADRLSQHRLLHQRLF